MKNDTLKAYEDALALAEKSLANVRAQLPHIKTIDQSVSADINIMLNAFKAGNTETIEGVVKNIMAKNEAKLKNPMRNADSI